MKTEDAQFTEWKKKRNITTWLAMVHVSLVGLEYSSVAISALYYLNDILHVQHARVFYGLTLGSMYTSSIISSIILGKYMDKMRDARKIILGTALLAILGNLLYSLPYSPWLLVVGRFLCGFSDATFPVMTGEFTRCYGKHELNNIISKHGMIYTCSFALGPCTPLIVEWIHYYHWPIILDQSNCIGILLMIVQIVFATCVYFGFSNLADEPGYNLFVESTQKNDACDKSNEVRNLLLDEDEESAKHVVNKLKHKVEPVTLRDMLTNFDVSLVTFSTAYFNFLSSTTDLITNMVCLYVLNWSLTEVSIATGVGILLNSVTSMLTYKRAMSNTKNVFFFNLVCFALMCMCLALLMFLKTQHVNIYMQWVLVVSLLFLNYYNGCSISTNGRLLLFSLVPPHSSSYCEGIRTASSRLLIGIAFYLVAFIYVELVYFFVSFIAIVTVIYISFFIRRQSFY